MRIISGKYKHRALNPPKGLPVRPTTDFAKTGLFNILNNSIDFNSIAVLDLFCGTGNISFEFLSRGAHTVVAVDSNKKCLDFIRKTAIEFDVDNIKAVRSDVSKFLDKTVGTFDIVFADPPYKINEKQLLVDKVLSLKILNSSGIMILEHPKEENYRVGKSNEE